MCRYIKIGDNSAVVKKSMYENQYYQPESHTKITKCQLKYNAGCFTTGSV